MKTKYDSLPDSGNAERTMKTLELSGGRIRQKMERRMKLKLSWQRLLENSLSKVRGLENFPKHGLPVGSPWLLVNQKIEE